MQTILSGIKPTNRITLGNYLGALKNWTGLQDEYDCFFPVVDLHSLTTSATDYKELSDNTWKIFASYIASGIDPKRSTIFIQSDVNAHG